MPDKFTLACIGTAVAALLVGKLFLPDLVGWIALIPIAFAAIAYRAWKRGSR